MVFFSDETSILSILSYSSASKTDTNNESLSFSKTFAESFFALLTSKMPLSHPIAIFVKMHRKKKNTFHDSIISIFA
jgi:hypothetical protein